MVFWQPMFGTERILTVIALKWHICHITAIGALFF